MEQRNLKANFSAIESTLQRHKQYLDQVSKEAKFLQNIISYFNTQPYGLKAITDFINEKEIGALDCSTQQMVMQRIETVNIKIRSFLDKLTKLTLSDIPRNDVRILLHEILDKYTYLSTQLTADVPMQVIIKSHLHKDREVIYNNPEQVALLKSTLKSIKQFFKQAGYTPRICFISYAWPVQRSNSDNAQEKVKILEDESWVQDFLKQLRIDLKKAGIQAILDIVDNSYGSNIYQFMEQAQTSNYVLLMGTESLLTKHRDGLSLVCTELNKIKEKRRQDYQQGLAPRVYPISLNGNAKVNFPAEYEGYSTIRFWQQKNYFVNLKELLRNIYDAGPDHKEYNALWNKFEAACPDMLKPVVQPPLSPSISTSDDQKFSYSKIAEGTGSPVYSRLSSEYQNKLKQHLKQHYTRQAKLKPILFDEDFSLETYINLAIVKEEHQALERQLYSSSTQRIGSYEDLYNPNLEHIVPLAQLFSTDQENSSAFLASERLLVIGRAGVGKTTFCQRMAYLWSTNQLWQKEFQWVFLVPLRNLKTDIYSQMISTQNVSAVKIEQVIKQECFAETKVSLEEIKKLIASEHYRCLLILDGFDEVNDIFKNSKHVLNPLLKQLLEFKNTLMTSRPEFIKGVERDRMLENVGFLNKDIPLYCAKFLENLKSQTWYEELLGFLKSNPSIWGTAHVPINLELICSVWYMYKRKSSNLPIPMTMTELYKEITYYLGRRYLEKREKDPITQDELDRMDRSVVEEKFKHVLQFLQTLAYKGITVVGRELIINNGIVRSTLSQFASSEGSNALLNDILRAGFLKATQGGATGQEKDYYFLHLTFQEFFAAGYLTNILQINNPETIAFIKQHKADPVYKVVFWFVSGLLKDNLAYSQEFFKSLLSDPMDFEFADLLRDENKRYLLLLTIRCLDERQLTNDWQVAIESKFKAFCLHVVTISKGVMVGKLAQIAYDEVVECLRLSPYMRERIKIVAELKIEASVFNIISQPQALITLSKIQSAHLDTWEIYHNILQHKDNKPEVHRLAIQLLAELNYCNPKIKQILSEYLQNSPNEIGMAVLKTVFALLPFDKSLVDLLIQARQHSDEEIKNSAFNALITYKYTLPYVLQQLETIFSDKQAQEIYLFIVEFSKKAEGVCDAVNNLLAMESGDNFRQKLLYVLMLIKPEEMIKQLSSSKSSFLKDIQAILTLYLHHRSYFSKEWVTAIRAADAVVQAAYIREVIRLSTGFNDSVSIEGLLTPLLDSKLNTQTLIEESFKQNSTLMIAIIKHKLHQEVNWAWKLGWLAIGMWAEMLVMPERLLGMEMEMMEMFEMLERLERRLAKLEIEMSGERLKRRLERLEVSDVLVRLERQLERLEMSDVLARLEVPDVLAKLEMLAKQEKPKVPLKIIQIILKPYFQKLIFQENILITMLNQNQEYQEALNEEIQKLLHSKPRYYMLLFFSEILRSLEEQEAANRLEELMLELSPKFVAEELMLELNPEFVAKENVPRSWCSLF